GLLSSALYCRILMNGREFPLYSTTNDVLGNRHDAAIALVFKGREPLCFLHVFASFRAPRRAKAYFFRASKSRKRSTASLGPKSSSSNNWRTSISASAPSPAGLGKRLVHSSASYLDFTWRSEGRRVGKECSLRGSTYE